MYCDCPVCGNSGYSIDVKEFPEYFRKEFNCTKCGRLIRAENWKKEYL